MTEGTEAELDLQDPESEVKRSPAEQRSARLFCDSWLLPLSFPTSYQ